MSTEISTHPFQVGARLRMTHVYSTRPNQTHEGAIGEIEPAGFDDNGDPFPPYVVLRDDSGKYLTSFPLAYDGTRIEYPESYRVEFLDDDATNPPTTAPRHYDPDAAPLSDRTLAKVLSRPAYVPRETPSLVELDRREAAERALAALVEWRKAGDVKAHIQATVALRKAADEYIEVQS